MRKRAAVFACALLLASAAAAQSKKIVVTGLGPENMGPEVVAEFQSAAPGLTVVEAKSQQDALREIVDADAIFGTINPALLHAAKHLQWVQIYSAGAENYMFPEFINSNITLTNCKIIQGPEISDHAMALLLSLTRRIDEAMPHQAREDWARGTIHPIELMNKTALIIGLGGIGTQIAQRAHAFGMRVLAVDPKDIPITNVVERIVKPDQLHEVLPEADVVFMSAPLTRQTQGMMGAAEFGMMKKDSYFVAVSRGRTYDSNALVKALDEKRLAGAGLDVTNPEPLPKGHPLWKFPNVVITPHIAGQSDALEGRRVGIIKENIRRWVAGKPMLNVVDKQKGY